MKFFMEPIKLVSNLVAGVTHLAEVRLPTVPLHPRKGPRKAPPVPAH